MRLAAEPDREIRQTALSVKSFMMLACVCSDRYSTHPPFVYKHHMVVLCMMYERRLLSAGPGEHVEYVSISVTSVSSFLSQ